MFTHPYKYQFCVIVALLVAGCETGQGRTTKPVPQNRYREEFKKLFEFASTDYPKEEIDAWHENLSVEKKNFQAGMQLEIVNGALDATKYHFSNDLKDAIIASKKIEWLCIGEKSNQHNFEWINELKQLRGLYLTDGARLQELENLENLQWLSISIEASEMPPLSKLEVLSLSSDNFTDRNVWKHNQLPLLKALDLRGTQLSDEGVRRLVEASPDLRYLILARSPNITSKSLDYLPHLKKLECLHLSGSKLEWEQLESGEKAIDELRRRMPKCYIGTGT